MQAYNDTIIGYICGWADRHRTCTTFFFQNECPAAMMTSRNFSSHTNFLAKTLGSTPAFAKYLLQSVEGKLLETKVIKEKAGGATVVNLEFRPAKGGKTWRKGRKKVDKQKSSQTPQKRKKKSPSRQRRDKQRRIMFLARRNQLTVSKTNFPQCPPPEDKVITVLDPPVVKLSSPTDTDLFTVTDPPSVDPPFVSPLDSSEATTAPDPKAVTLTTDPPTAKRPGCVCDICNRFNANGDVDPIIAHHKQCDNCGQPSSFTQPLKPCSRCLIRAYCGKKCQKADWSEHKSYCNKKTGKDARELRVKWLEAREVWLEHIFEPLILPIA